MKKKKIIISLILLIILLFVGFIYFFEKKDSMDDNFSKWKLITDLNASLILLNENYSKELNYSKIFDTNINNFNDVKDLLVKNWIIKDFEQPYFYNFNKIIIKEKCFVFALDLNKINTKLNNTLNFYKDNYWRTSYEKTWIWNIDKNYLFFTEKWLLEINDAYKCE